MAVPITITVPTTMRRTRVRRGRHRLGHAGLSYCRAIPEVEDRLARRAAAAAGPAACRPTACRPTASGPTAATAHSATAHSAVPHSATAGSAIGRRFAAVGRGLSARQVALAAAVSAMATVVVSGWYAAAGATAIVEMVTR